MLGLVRLVRRIQRAVFSAWVRHRAGSVGRDLKVNGYSSVNARTVLGDNVNMNGLRIVGGGEVRIGDNFHSGPDCLFITQVHNYDHGTAIPYDGTYEFKPIYIGHNVWLGSRVIVLGGVRIEEGAIVQAGSCVVSDIPRCAIAGGHPARVFRHRDIEHYERLKGLGKFH